MSQERGAGTGSGKEAADDLLHQAQRPRFKATAQGVNGDVAAIAYSVNRVVPGPNGEWHQAFVVLTRDAGDSWFCLPLVRTIWSCLRFWGFPVWPPEYIDAVAGQREHVRITFRDESVDFEPGGESRWTGSCSSRGIWDVRRVRFMDYDGADSPQPAQPILVTLPEGFRPPPVQLLDRVASRLAADTRVELRGREIWALALPIGVAVALLGPSWWLLPVVLVYLVGLEVVSILTERRRHRHMLLRP